MRRERFEEHVNLIYQAVGSEEGWQELLNQLVTDLDARSAFMAIDNVKTQEMVVATGAGISEQDWGLTTGDFLGNDTWTNKIYSMPAEQFHESESMISKSELFGSELYNELCTLVDLRYAVASLIHTHDDHAVRIAIQGAHDQEDFSNSVDYLIRLIPHLRQAGQLHRKIGPKTLSNRGLQTLIEQVPEPVAIIDRYANLHCHNTLFDNLLVAGSILQARGTCLNVEGKPELLANSLNKLLTLGPNISPLSPIELHIGESSLKLESLDCTPRFDSLGILTPLTMLTVSGINPKSNIDVELVRQRFGLTPKEIRITEGLVAGMSLEEISSSNSRSIYTIRAQLASVFRKTETNSQARLVTMLAKLKS